MVEPSFHRQQSTSVLTRTDPWPLLLVGAALARNAARVLTDGIRVTGVDYDEHYIKKARAIIIEHGSCGESVMCDV